MTDQSQQSLRKSFANCGWHIRDESWRYVDTAEDVDHLNYYMHAPWMVDWTQLSSNATESAVGLLMAVGNRIDWREFSRNPSGVAVQYMLCPSHISQIEWVNFSRNPCPYALQYLREHPGLIIMPAFWENPNVVDDYEEIARDYFREHVAAELMALVWHPRNMTRFGGLGFDPNV